MSLLEFKILAAATIFLIAMIGGILPLHVIRNHKKALALGDAFASGIFLGAALFHLLPEASDSFRELYTSHTYPFAFLICILGFLFLLITERIVLQISEPHYHDEKRVTALLLLIILSIHSLIEGGAVGINTSMSEAVVIYLAIMAHKGSASFALAANLRKTSMQFRTLILMIVFFSLMSPLGIIIAATITTLLQDNTGKLIEACFNAFAAGTFLYIGARHLMEKEHAEFTHTNQISEFSVVVLGILLMAILAIWI